MGSLGRCSDSCTWVIKPIIIVEDWVTKPIFYQPDNKQAHINYIKVTGSQQIIGYLYIKFSCKLR